MSPQRKKGRGGGGGKTMAPLPSSLGAPAMDSPRLIPTKLDQDQRRNIRDLLGVAHKSSLSPAPSHLLQHRSKLKDRGEAPRARSVLPRLAAPLSSQYPKGGPHRLETKTRAESRPRSQSSPRLGISNSRGAGSGKNVKASERAPQNVPGKASGTVGNSRVRTSSTVEESKKISRASSKCKADVTMATVKAPVLVKEQSQSCRTSLQRESLSEGLRWSTASLPVHSGKVKTASGGLHTKLLLSNASQCDVQDERMSTGSSIMSVDNCTMSGCDGVQNGAVLSSISRPSAVAGTNSRIAPAFQQPEASGVSLKYDVHADQPAPNGLKSFSSSLHRRLSLLEGKVSRIAAELKKTKEMLDTNDTTGSVALLSDIQGKISSIERAMACRLSDTEASSPEDSIMEDQHIPSMSKSLADSGTEQAPALLQVSTTGSVRFNSEQVSLVEICPVDGSNSDPARAARASIDQQELEDRLFPHRKLLKARVPLQERVAESRAALHSKLDEGLLQGQVNLFQALPIAGNESSVAILTCSTQSPFMEVKEMPTMPDCIEVVSAGVVHPYNGSDGVEYQYSGKSETFNCGLASHPLHAGFNISGSKVLDEGLRLDAQCSSEQGIPCTKDSSPRAHTAGDNATHLLECDESLPSSFYENQENLAPADAGVEIEYDDHPAGELHVLGSRIATAGWYVCEGEAIVLAHDDGCCSFYDVANMEEKSVYEGPEGIISPLWNDCWLIRAGGLDGQINKYIVAATAGSAVDCGFCSWDLNSRSLAAYHCEYESTSPNPSGSTQNSSLAVPYQSVCCDSPQWWYRPCGPLMASAGSLLKGVALYDIRDGDTVMTWHTNRPVASLDYSSPLQWRNKGKLAVAEEQGISVWDVNRMKANCLQYVELPGKRITALQMQNADAECSGGVRQRFRSSENEAYDGVCCTQDEVNVLDFRVPNGIGMSLCAQGQNVQSMFARGDNILTGSVSRGTANACEVRHWSIRRAGPVCTYALPSVSSHYAHLALAQVWGSLDAVMAVNGNGLYIFQGWMEAGEEGGHSCRAEEVRDVIGTQDLFNPSFDYANSRVLLISRDRPAYWCYWPQ